MPKAIGVKLRATNEVVKIILPADEEADFNKGDIIIVSLDGNKEAGEVVYIIKTSGRSSKDKKFVRKASYEDLKKIEEVTKEEKRAFEVASKKIEKHNLRMKLAAVSLSYDGKNLTFYFTAEGRIDFRDLLKDLVATFKKMIRLQQIGPKDAAKLMGGYGPCGRRVCCQTFLSDMKSITMDLAREQNIEGVTSSKISGLCGKLMCCLDYEKETYRDLRKNLPEIGETVTIKGEIGKVIAQNILSQKVTLKTKDGKRLEKDYSKK